MDKGKRAARSALSVTLVIILSKALGFGRDIVTTAFFGTTMQNDAYVSAYSLFYVPVLLFNSCISATLIPLYMDEREKNGQIGSNRFASTAINHFAIISLLISIVMIIFAPWLVSLVYPGFDAEKLALTAKLTRIMLLALVFNVTSISLSSLLNASEKFIAAQLTGFPLSFCVMGATVFFSGTKGIAAVAWGVFAANVLQMFILLPFTRGWFKYSPVIDVKSQSFRRLIVLALPAMLSMGVSELNHLIDHALASGLASGTLTSMTSAYRLITFLQGILIVPLTTIMFSKMSRRVAEGDEAGANGMLLESLLKLAVVVLPVVAIGAVMSLDVIKFAYMRGKFNLDDAKVTAGVLLFYIIGVPSFGMKDFLTRMFHALKDTKTPFRVSCVIVASNICLNLILRRVMGANGLALATSISSYIGSTIMLVLLRKRFGKQKIKPIIFDLAKIILSTLVTIIVCIVLNKVMPEMSGTLGAFVRLAVCALGSIIVYVFICIALKVRAFKTLLSELTR